MLFTRTLPLAGFGLCLVACGGAKTTPQNSSDPGKASDESVSDIEEEGAATGEVAPSRPDCSDGTCFECGSGICPEGSYCDAVVGGESGCAWLPECSKSPSCSCIQQVLGASCSCTDDGRGPQVTCQ